MQKSPPGHSLRSESVSILSLVAILNKARNLPVLRASQGSAGIFKNLYKNLSLDPCIQLNRSCPCFLLSKSFPQPVVTVFSLFEV